MMRGIFSLFSFVSAVLFPWPLTALLAVALSFFEPLIPLSVGLFVDVLYYTPQTGALPLFTLSGAVMTTLALLVRSRLVAGSMGE